MTRRGKRERPQITRKCIFCGRGGLTREHIWPDWAADLLPDAVGSEVYRQTLYPTDPAGARTDYRRPRQGGVKKHKVQAVCGQCNNGWMSVLETDAKPMLAAMIEGRAFSVLADGLDILRAWITLKVMVAEHDSLGLAAIPAAEKQAFAERREIPSGLSVRVYWCGEPAWRTHYRRHATTLLSQPPPPDFDPTVKNVKTVVLGIGDALFVGLYRRPEVHLSLEGDERYTLALLPPEAGPAVWPPARRLTAAGAAHVSEVFDRLLKGPTVKHINDWQPPG